MLLTMTIASVVVGPVKLLNMLPLEARLVAILVMIQGQGYTDYLIIRILKYRDGTAFLSL